MHRCRLALAHQQHGVPLRRLITEGMQSVRVMRIAALLDSYFCHFAQ
jgi:hypothetical protein